MSDVRRKEDNLRKIFRDCGSVGVAFSGGVDSTYLLALAQEVLGNQAVALTAETPMQPHWEREEARAFCARRGIRQEILESDVWRRDAVRSNPPDRCYHCKRGIFSEFLRCAQRLGLGAVVDGSNVDDAEDYRPGMKAIAELGIRSPLREVGLSKEEIRRRSKQMGLSTWDKPSFACLASRIPYGEEIDARKLDMVERAERFLFELGIRQVRVRIHGNLARIETEPSEITKIADPAARAKILAAFRELGFTYITLDLAGYRTGSLNEVLK